MSRQKFKPEEDNLLTRLVKRYHHDWVKIAKQMNRTQRQCRERWKYFLSPRINKEPFTQEEDTKLKKLVQKYGTNWKKIRKHLHTHRTLIQIKNRYKHFFERRKQYVIPMIKEVSEHHIKITQSNDLRNEEPVDVPPSDEFTAYDPYLLTRENSLDDMFKSNLVYIPD